MTEGIDKRLLLWANRRKLSILALLSVVLSVVIYVWQPVPLQLARNAVFDQYQRWKPREYWALPVRIIDIDEQSLKQVGQWPWPRNRFAELLNKLHAKQPAAIAFDIIFAESDRTSPKTVVEQWELPAAVRQQITALPDNDQVFAQALGQGRMVVGFAAMHTESSTVPLKSPAQFVNMGLPALDFANKFSHVLKCLPLFEKAAAGIGALNFLPDGDGVVRRVPLVLNVADSIRPSLVAETMRIAQSAQNYLTKASLLGLESVLIGKFDVPTTATGEIWLHYTPTLYERRIPAWKVLANQVPDEMLASTILIIGSSGQGLGDNHLSPFGEMVPGVEIHAQAIEQMMTGQTLKRPAWTSAVELLVMILTDVLLIVLAFRYSLRLAGLVAIAVVLTMAGLGWLIFDHYAILLDTLSPILSLILCFLMVSNLIYLANEGQQRWIRQVFSRYVSPNLVDYLVQHPEQLELGGQRRQCSFIFTDLEGFTGFMESHDPADVVDYLNTYLEHIITIIFKHNGTLDRFVGDAVAVMFSAPVIQSDHQLRAVECALEIHAFAKQYTSELNEKGIPFGRTRIGVHSGEVIVGNFGGETMFDYRALGDAVNTASRLEGVNKFLDTLICISEATLSACPNIPVRPVGRLLLKGKNVPLLVFQPLTGGEFADRRYTEAYNLMAKQDPGALEAFANLAFQRSNDSLVQLHYHRLQTGKSGDLLVFDAK